MNKNDQSDHLEIGRFVITERSLRSPRKSFVVSEIEKIVLRRPLLIFAALFLVLIVGAVNAFWELIYPHELPWVLGVPLLSVWIASRIAVLNIRIRTQRQDDTVIGGYGELKRVRDALDDMVDRRNERPTDPGIIQP